jgi:hypothetical protein
VLISDLRERGGFDFLQLWDEGLLKVKQDPSGQIKRVCPPEFEGSWQHAKEQDTQDKQNRYGLQNPAQSVT